MNTMLLKTYDCLHKNQRFKIYMSVRDSIQRPALAVHDATVLALRTSSGDRFHAAAPRYANDLLASSVRTRGGLS